MSRLGELRMAVERAVVDAVGSLSSAVRRGVVEGTSPPADAAAFVAKVRDRSHDVTEADIAALREAGYSEAAIFELTVSAALGAAKERYARAAAALR